MRTAPVSLAILVVASVAARAPLAYGQSAPVDMIHVDPPEQSAGPPLAPGATSPAEGKVWVELKADGDVRLEELSPAGHWETTCAAPCGIEVPAGLDYRVAGSGSYASPSFKLQGRPGQRVLLDVSMASKAGFGVGITLVTAGGLAAFLGLYVASVASVPQCSGTDEGLACSSNGGTVRTSLVVALVGAVGAIAGIVLAESNRRTTTSQALIHGPSTARNDHDGAWVRLPTWTEPAGVERALPAAQVVPIFSRSF